MVTGVDNGVVVEGTAVVRTVVVGVVITVVVASTHAIIPTVTYKCTTHFYHLFKCYRIQFIFFSFL